MNRPVIAGYSRSPFTLATKGALVSVRPEDLLSEVIKNLVIKSKINPEDIEDIIAGCAFPEGEQGFNIGKIVTFFDGMNINTAGMTVNRWCGSSMQSIHIAAGAISMGAGNAFICCGVESMTRVPMNGFNSTQTQSYYFSYIKTLFTLRKSTASDNIFNIFRINFCFRKKVFYNF
jgi:acetyl-CoA acyltransferase